MTERDRDDIRPVEESPEVASAIDDDITVPRLASESGPDQDTPAFLEPGAEPAGPTEDLLGDPYGSGSDNATGYRTGAEQPWEAEDLAAAEGRDRTPENVRRAQRELGEGPAAIERTVP